MIQRFTAAPGYGGDVLQFKETEDTVFAIHRVWKLDKRFDRTKLIRSPNPEDRKNITQGCVNVDELVYDELVECCRTLIIEP